MLPFPHEKDKPLKEISTFGIGGPARFYAEAKTKEEMQCMLSYCYQKRISFFVLGKGSNCLFDDRGYAGLVLHNKIDYLQSEGNCFKVGSGYSFARLGGQTARQGWTGLEFAAGIPATVGGAIFMNAGANGKETADCLVEVEYIDEEGKFIRYKKEDLIFSYRCSPFQKKKGAIVEGVFALKPHDDAKKIQKEIVDYRLKTQPYGDKSAGCAFRNPLNASAGRLIEKCGLKGLKIGGAEVSSLHANFIVNKGNATAEDVCKVMKVVKEKIHSETGIHLEEEIHIVPYDE